MCRAFLCFDRILYADLEFQPEERFSLAARMLLQGMIKRDPATRMGALENPPQDIMNAPFFHGIQWDAIYERRFDGPYVPEVPVFGKSRRGVEGEGEQGSGPESSGKAQGQVDDGSVSGEDSESELKGMRDSVFIRPHDGAGNNLLDWSFIDEQVLAETYAEGDPADPLAAKKAAKRRKKRAAEALAQAQAQEGNISAQIDNNKVGFASSATATTAQEGAPAVEGEVASSAVAEGVEITAAAPQSEGQETQETTAATESGGKTVAESGDAEVRSPETTTPVAEQRSAGDS
jgi:hypothetical protein